MRTPHGLVRLRSVISSSFTPQTTYNFFQFAAAATLCVAMFFGLKNALPFKQRLLLVLSAIVLIKPFAELTTQIVAHSQGQSYSGALVAQILGIWIFLKLSRTPHDVRRRVWNVFSIFAGFVYAILRVGCHFRGCCWGKICGFPWAHYYRTTDVVTPWVFLPLHPVQLYSALHGVLISLLVIWYLKKFPERNALAIFLILMGGGRLVTDIFRADAAFYNQSLFGFEPNTLLSVGFITVGLLLTLKKSE